MFLKKDFENDNEDIIQFEEKVANYGSMFLD